MLIPACRKALERFPVRTAANGSRTKFVAMAAADGCRHTVAGFTSPAVNSFITDHVSITVPYSKCDQYRRGDSVCVATISTFRYCPVQAAQEYIAVQCRAETTEETLVSRSVSVKHSGSLVLGRAASRAVLQDQLRKFLAVPCFRSSSIYASFVLSRWEDSCP